VLKLEWQTCTVPMECNHNLMECLVGLAQVYPTINKKGNDRLNSETNVFNLIISIVKGHWVCDINSDTLLLPGQTLNMAALIYAYRHTYNVITG